MCTREPAIRTLAFLAANCVHAAKSALIACQRSRNLSENNRIARNVPVSAIFAISLSLWSPARRYRPSAELPPLVPPKRLHYRRHRRALGDCH